MSVKNLKIKIPVTVRRGISKRSHEKIGDCEQSTLRKVSVGAKTLGGSQKLLRVMRKDHFCKITFNGGSAMFFRTKPQILRTPSSFLNCL